jgi:hypothetical protein
MANPKGYYTSRYSGEEIDRLLSGIPPGGAADKSVQDIVEATSVPSRTEEVAAADLQGYISKLPRLLTEHLTISVIGTAKIGFVWILNLYGPGSLTIRVVDGVEVTVQTQAKVEYCSVPITLDGLKIIGDNSGGGNILGANYSSLLVVRNCVIDREHDPSKVGVQAANGSRMRLEQCQITHCNPAINCLSSSDVYAINCTGENNVRGIVAAAGSVMLGGTTPELMGGIANNKNGGLIVKVNGTLI